MKVLLKLCFRDLIHRKVRLGFTVLAIAAVSCLMIWFVGSLDLNSLMKRDVVKKTFGEYSAVMFLGIPSLTLISTRPARPRRKLRSTGSFTRRPRSNARRNSPGSTG